MLDGEKKQMKPGSIDTSVVAKLMKLYPETIPEHLLRENPVRMAGDFDPNSYFSVLRRLSIKPGYTLDYVYDCYIYWEGWPEEVSSGVSPSAGSPCLYARAIDEKPLNSSIGYRDWIRRNDLLSFLVADGSSDAFFQLAVFRELAGQFYLFWHADYNAIRLLVTPEEVEALIFEVNSGNFGAKFTDKQMVEMRRIAMQPTVEVFDDWVSITYCWFSKWLGLHRSRTSFRRQGPHLLIDYKVLGGLAYDCRICY